MNPKKIDNPKVIPIENYTNHFDTTKNNSCTKYKI